MKYVRKGTMTALALVTAMVATHANAQNIRGFRAEVQAGYDNFESEGTGNSKIGYGAAAGVDFDLGGFVLGPEVTFWNSPNENETFEGGGLAERKSFQEWALALRGGVQIAPSTFIYGKVGYVQNEQRKRFTPLTGIGYYDHYKANGWQWGAGINQMLTDMFYVSVEGRYSDYQNKHNLGGTHRFVGLVGLGAVLGGSRVEAAPPPPPPPPPPPATQTCPDGSVIAATDTCPPPPPPPPPPATQGERG
jgi:outer membrane immunogenic protein